MTVSKQAQHRPNVVLKDAKEDGKHKTPTVLEVHHPPYPVPWRISPLSRARDNQPHPQYFGEEKTSSPLPEAGGAAVLATHAQSVCLFGPIGPPRLCCV